jgi:hypothetical protein
VAPERHQKLLRRSKMQIKHHDCSTNRGRSTAVEYSADNGSHCVSTFLWKADISLNRALLSSSVGALLFATLTISAPANATSAVAPLVDPVWEQLSGGPVFSTSYLAAATVVSSNSGDTIEVYATEAATHALWVNTLSPSTCNGQPCVKWGGWVNLGGYLFTAPSAVSGLVFTLSTDLNAYVNTRSGSLWSGWQSIGSPAGGFCTAPSAMRDSNATPHVFVRGCDGHLYHKWVQNGSWVANWENLGGDISTTPFAIKGASEPVAVYAGTSWGGIWVCRFNSSTGWVWSGTDVPTFGPPTATAFGREDSVFGSPSNPTRVAGASSYSGGGFNPVQYSAQEGWTSAGAHAVHVTDFNSLVFYIDSAGHVKELRWYETGSWASTTPDQIGTYTFTGDPAATDGCGVTNSGACNYGAHVFASSSSGVIYHSYVY